MKITKKQLTKIIQEELTHSSIGASRSPEEVFESANESLNQAHKDLQTNMHPWYSTEISVSFPIR